MRRSVLLPVLLLTLATATPAGAAPPPRAAPVTLAAAPVQVYGAWHCGNDFCTWGTVRTVTEFDSQNHWLVDRGDGRPSVNLAVLSFVNPLALLHQTTDASTLDGVPRGITPEIVGYFTSRGVRVMLSIGGITYTDDWDAALAENPTLLGQRAAAVASRLGVGIEIDYEQNTGPNLAGLQSFIDAYRAVHPYDATGARPEARLTIDVAAGDRWLIDLNRKATADWLRTDAPVLDYANAMVSARPVSASTAQASWQEHVDGKPQYSPPVPPLAPAKFSGGLYLAYGGKPLPECVDYATSVQRAAAPYVQTVAPKGAGVTAGMLGFMFWAAERPSTRGIGTVPPNTCEGGAGAGATALAVPVPMPALRQS
ncbi:hypothetical protein OG799_12755 [Micromonospora sp. NBC_00898]|uniref:hypothetical protein n=1 Tax=Micromonospora sp. NBC_00898 TaxID=2975981 RepID=UPI003864F7C6|nr:hypothetical protein OG799_12755 [Micromonospora sp. NBC_00898]